MSTFASQAARAACLPLIAAAALGSSTAARAADLYVSGAGTDGFDGTTPSTPKATIQAAIAAAVPPCTVKVALGEYLGSAQAGTNVVLRDGVSLSGGWSADFSARNPAANVTTIRDTSAVGGTSDLPNTAVFAGDGVTGATVVEGFTLLGGGGDNSAAVVTTGTAAPVIRGNTLVGGSLAQTGAPTRSIGLHLASPAKAVGNAIRAQSADYSYGVRISGSTPLVASNVIDGGTGYWSFGVNASNSSSPSVAGNTIDGGSPTQLAFGIYAGSSTPTLANNLVFASGGTYRVCVAQGNAIGGIVQLSSNDLFDCPAGLVARPAPATGNCLFNASAGTNLDCYLLASQANDAGTLGFGTASGNVSVDPGFASAGGGDYHLTATSPASVARGGLDLSSTFSVDADGAARTAPWSIGAYELDADPGTGSGDPPAGEAPEVAKEDVLACGAASPGSAWWLGLPALLHLLSRRSRRGTAGALVLVLATAGVARASPADRVVILPLKAGASISEPVAEAVSDALVAAIQARSGAAVLGARDLEAALSFEKRKQMLGCTEELSCLAEIGGALGAGRIVYGSVARVGETLTFSAQLLDVKRAAVLVRFHQKLPGAGEQALLDVAEQAAAELFPGERPPAAPSGPTGAPAALQGQDVGRPYALVAGATSTRSAGGLVGAGLGYRFGPHVAAELRALYTGGGWYGAGARITGTFGAWRLRPFVALEAAFLASDAGAAALGGELGVEFRLDPRIRLAAGIPLLFLANGPSSVEAAYLLVGGSASMAF